MVIADSAGQRHLTGIEKYRFDFFQWPAAKFFRQKNEIIAE